MNLAPNKTECEKDKSEINMNKLKTDILTVPVSMHLDEAKGQKEKNRYCYQKFRSFSTK